MKRIFLLMSLFAFVCLANAQTQSTITGKVKDAATGEFLMGVNVRVDGTTTGILQGQMRMRNSGLTENLRI